MVLPDLKAKLVHPAQGIQCRGISLVGGQMEILQGSGIVPRPPQTVEVQHAHVQLCCGVSIVGGLAIPELGCAVVLFYPQGVGVHHAQLILCCGISARCCM